MRTIFVGLGYSCDLFDSKDVSFIPLLSYYKAWFDSYSPQRTLSWLQTTAYGLIQAIADRYVTYFDGVHTINAQDQQNFNKFFTDLAKCFYATPDDFVSVHRSKPILDGRTVKYTDEFAVNGFYNMESGSNTNPPKPLSLTMLSTIQKLTRFVNKDSVIGKKMTDWVKVLNGRMCKNTNKISGIIGSLRNLINAIKTISNE